MLLIKLKSSILTDVCSLRPIYNPLSDWLKLLKFVKGNDVVTSHIFNVTLTHMIAFHFFTSISPFGWKFFCFCNYVTTHKFVLQFCFSFLWLFSTLTDRYISFFWQDDLTTTLVHQCRQSQSTVQRIVETAGDNEALLFEALNVNDEIQKVLDKYDDMKKPPSAPAAPEPAMISIADEPEESPRAGKEDALVRKPARSRGNSHGGQHDDMMDDLDEMIFGKKSGTTSEVGIEPTKPQSAKDDLISL